MQSTATQGRGAPKSENAKTVLLKYCNQETSI